MTADLTEHVDDAARPAEPRIPVRLRPRTPTDRLAATWKQADPARIAASLADAQTRSPGGWMVAAATSELPASRSLARSVAGREVVFWRGADGAVHAGPGACPHLGALMHDCPVTGDALRCKWHGLALGPAGRSDWRPYRAVDDGVLLWVQLPDSGETPTPRPTPVERPPLAASVSAVIEVEGRCEPRDIIANRLDPWHGSWLHPYAFSHLTVDEDASTTGALVVDVTFRLGRRLGVPVRAVFSCPDARTITMHIVDGEGAGSVVETHATPLAPGPDGAPRTRMTEATIAYSSRRGFTVAKRLQAAVRPAVRRTARHLWRDDMDYAERTYAVRAGEVR